MDIIAEYRKLGHKQFSLEGNTYISLMNAKLRYDVDNFIEDGLYWDATDNIYKSFPETIEELKNLLDNIQNKIDDMRKLKEQLEQKAKKDGIILEV